MPITYQSRKQRLIDFFEKHRRLPSYQEMLGLFCLRSKNAVYQVVQKFIKEDLIDKDSAGKLAPKSLLGSVKLLGDIEAGFPSPAEEELVDTISLDDYLIKNKNASFLLRVTGESMKNAGIVPGDLVIVDRGRTPHSRDIVVAEVDGEWTIKYFRKYGQKVVLVPANSRFRPITPKQNLRVAGVVVSVIRKYN
jgi:repressor LexA